MLNVVGLDRVFFKSLSLFLPPLGRVFGPLDFSRRDLMAQNIQRGRDHGLPDYNTARVSLGLDRKENFSDINVAEDGDISFIDESVG